MAGVFTLTGTTGTVGTGQSNLQPTTIAGTLAVGEVLSLALASGDNTITVPTGAVGITIVPPNGNAIVIKYRTSLNSGDGGLPVNTGAGFCTQQFPSTAPTTVILNAASSISAITQVWFI